MLGVTLHQERQVNLCFFRKNYHTLLTSKVPIPPYFLWASEMTRTMKHLALGIQ